jgi:hypothetical protein
MEKKHDYLKYWKVIRHWTESKYDITTLELEFLLYVYSEKIISQKDVRLFSRTGNFSDYSFEKLKERKLLLDMFPEIKEKYKTYKLSYKASRIIDVLYRKLHGEEICVFPQKNKLFLKNISSKDKIYQSLIIRMNEEYKSKKARNSTLDDEIN